MSTFTYKKVSYLNDPYQQYLMNKGKNEAAKSNDKYLNPNAVTKSTKKENRTTRLLLDVNEFGIFSNIDSTDRNIPNKSSSTGNKGNHLHNQNNTTSISNISLVPPSSTSFSMQDEFSDTMKSNNRSSFMNPLMDMKFDVGGLFDDGDKDGEDIFGDIMSKFDSMDSNNDTLNDLQNQKRLNRNTIKMEHSRNGSNDTIKASNSIKASGTIKARGTIKASDSVNGSGTIKSSGTIKLGHDKHDSQDTIKIRDNNIKKVDSFDNQLIQNLNDKPAIVVDKTFLSDNNDEDDVDNESNKGFDPNIYKEDEKYDFADSDDWDSPWRSNNNKSSPSSMKSSQSKLSAFSSFTIKSSKKIGKLTKNIYKKFMKQKETPHYPVSPLDIPESYNEKERAFEEMILRDDTISLSLSNPNGSLTSTFADKTFPLTENVNGNQNDNSIEVENEYANKSFVSTASSEDSDTYSVKRRHRKGINFEEALKEGNGFRVSLANM